MGTRTEANEAILAVKETQVLWILTPETLLAREAILEPTIWGTESKLPSCWKRTRFESPSGTSREFEFAKCLLPKESGGFPALLQHLKLTPSLNPLDLMEYVTPLLSPEGK
ncbi:hypothetical protein TL16_g12557 [Triparma laevis f. inornata]|uniref:Uncharacterized protein n=1 Tax=Triparma laevis f. inornata TaxID=1714386 RepID=A0A9W7BSD0_9STRA|nr:hypothetical protein TL16_g12557 [Triparma laevis f. inornata]